MSRRVVETAIAAWAVIALAGCSSGGGTHTQSLSPSPSDPSTGSAGSTGASTSPGPTWTPPAYGAAQPAVSAYEQLQASVDKAFTDPAAIPASSFDSYLIGDAKTLFDAALYNEKKAGRYYRGTPDQQRIRVVSMNMTTIPKTVVLSSCPLPASTDPSTEYAVSTGKPVSATGAPAKVKPPYGHTVKVVYLTGRWLMSEFKIDATKTCTP